MTPITVRGTPVFLLILMLGAAQLGACSSSQAASLPKAVPALDLPTPTPPRPPIPLDLATMVYPDVDSGKRDPFLTVMEQELLEGPKVDLVAQKKEVVKQLVIHVTTKVIQEIHEQVKGIIVGPPNLFLFKGRDYREGDVVENSEWVVSGISETGIRLRTKDGSGSQYLKFKVDAVPNWEFHDGARKQ
jgi:hypothetical protein